jgi:hypothetical protein
MFADIHNLHHFISLEQGGSVTATSWVGGTNSGNADIYFGESELESEDSVCDLFVDSSFFFQVLPISPTPTLLRAGSVTTKWTT